VARLRKKEKFTALMHHVSVEALRGLTWRLNAAPLQGSTA